MKRLYRDRFDKKLGGVCGGLGQYLQFDSTWVRIIFLFLTIFTGGIFFLIYLLMWAVIPLGPRAYIEAHYKKLYRSRRDRKVAGICGGLGAYFRVDSNILRLVVVVLLFVTGILPVLITYVVGIAIIPEEPHH